MEFELKLTNGSWNDKLNDSNSTDFLNLKKKLEQEFDQVFCVKPDATVSQLNDSCRTQVTSFSEGSINVFFLLIRIELKQLFRGVAQLLVGFIYTFWFFLSFITSLSGQNKKDQNIFQLHHFSNPFSQLPAVERDSKNGAARKSFGPSYFVTALE